MDLQLYGQVVWRHRWLLAIGLMAAVALAALSVVHVEVKDYRPTFSYRQPEVWQATTRLMLTSPSFPMGRTEFLGEGDSGVFSDPEHLSSLTSFYAQLAENDAVQSEVLSGRSEAATLAATPVIDPTTQDPAPFLDILGLAETPLSAARISLRGAVVFTEYISQRQVDAGIPENDRVLLQIVRRPLGLKGPELVQARKKTTPAFVFLAVLTATFGLIFVVDNARARRRPVAVAAESEDEPTADEPEDEVALPLHESGKGLLSGRRWGMEP